TPQNYTLSLHDALPISKLYPCRRRLEYLPNYGLTNLPKWLRYPELQCSSDGSGSIYLHRAVGNRALRSDGVFFARGQHCTALNRSEEHTSELQSRGHLV